MLDKLKKAIVYNESKDTACEVRVRMLSEIRMFQRVVDLIETRPRQYSCHFLLYVDSPEAAATLDRRAARCGLMAACSWKD